MGEIDERGVREVVDDTAAATGFSGVVRLDRGGVTEVDAAFGLADRRHGIPMTTATRLGTASGTKALTAVTVMSLVTEGLLSLATPVRDVLGDDLPLVDDRVTVEHLLTHRSGIGDYVDEEVFTDVTDHVLAEPVHTLTTAEDYLTVLDGRPQAFAPGAQCVYNNGAFVVLAIVAGRVAGRTYEQLVTERVLEPAGMARSGFLRSDELPADAAIGYLWDDRPRTNLLHLPVVGSGDGGLYTTTGDVAAFWRALDSGTLLPSEVLADMMVARGTEPSGQRYGLGLGLGLQDGVVSLVGSDAGVSFRSVLDRNRDLAWTVISNTSEGAWPLSRALIAHLAD
ncbi:serine hydrolase domain-containing protein [Oryzobacter telluris]|uniref:serine hydrolase domain-containing protein n=1 Tax=Oryzobacter telluris TaxID=3149179 RepID=UPI00370D4049